MKDLRFLPLVLLVALSPSIGAELPPGAIREVQSRLFDLGFYNGALDGKPGPRTTKAIEAFTSAFMLQPFEGVSAELATALRLEGFEPTASSEIIILNERPETVASELLEKADAKDVWGAISNARDETLWQVRASAEPLATLFVIHAAIGDTVMTQIEVINPRAPRDYNRAPVFVENYYYKLADPGPPFLIVNPLEVGTDLFITLRAYVNGELVAERRVRSSS